jgi:hypothetical protein
MNSSACPPDDLQKAWREDQAESNGGQVLMNIQLLREKHRSLRDLIWGQDLAEYVLSLAFTPLTAFAAWKAKASVIQFGYGIITIVLVAGAFIIWLNERGLRFDYFDSNVTEYHRRLLQLYDRRIRFLKSVKFWYAIPLFTAASLVMLPLSTTILAMPWGFVLLSVLLLIAWLGVWHMNDVRRVGELRRRREEVQQLIEEMDRE